MFRKCTLLASVFTGWSFLAASALQGQSVTVTLSLDTNRIAVGATTTLRAFAQIVPAQRANADRIFSWYVDLLNTAGSVASLNASQLQRTASDQDPRTSSSGTADGTNLHGIFDTFINTAGAGRASPIELFAIPVQGVTPGRDTFRVKGGSGVPELAADFIVAPAGAGDPLLGGDYSAATLDLEVTAGQIFPSLAITSSPLTVNTQRLIISFPTTDGRTHTVEFRNNFGSGPDWQPLPAAPHNSGTVFDTNALPRRFYRLRVSP